MAQTYKALIEKGYDPNSIIISKPARRDKRIFRCDYLHRNVVHKIDNRGNIPQRMPLRMVVSQKARRDFDPIYEDKSLSQCSSKPLEDFLYNSPSIQEENIFPYSHYSKRKKPNVISPSIRRWLQNPYFKTSSVSSQLINENTNDNINCSKYRYFSEKSPPRTVNKKDCQGSEPALINASFLHMGIGDNEDTVHQLENTDTLFTPQKSLQDSFNKQSFSTLKKSTFPEYSQNFDNSFGNERSSIHDILKDNSSQNFMLKYSSSNISQEKAIDFKWDPVCIQSISEVSFKFTPEVINFNTIASSESFSLSNSSDLVDEDYKSDIF